MTAQVEVGGLTVRYGDVTAVDDLTFSLAGEKIYGLLGRNGSGKTSLLSTIAGFRKAAGGTVLVDGEPVFENGAVTKKLCLIRHTSDVAEKGDKLSRALEYAGVLRETWDGDYAAELIEKFRLPLDKKLGDLSLGQRSAFGIVIGLASRALVTMFDESHLGMDTPSRYAFYDALLSDFMVNPRTVIISTHLIEELASLLEEVVIIDEGKLVLHEEVEALRGRGTSVTGIADVVDRFVADLTVLNQEELGRTKSAMVYGSLDDARRAEARETGLDLGPIALQDLFVHLTEPAGGSR